MTSTFKLQEWEEMWDEAAQSITYQELNTFESFHQLHEELGRGGVRNIEVHPDISLKIVDYKLHEDVLIKIPEWNHPLQFCVLLSGSSINEDGRTIGNGYTCISGSGVQPQMSVRYTTSKRVGIDIHMSPDVLGNYFADDDGEIIPQLRFLAKDDDWQALIYPEITTAIEEWH